MSFTVIPHCKYYIYRNGNFNSYQSALNITLAYQYIWCVVESSKKHFLKKINGQWSSIFRHLKMIFVVISYDISKIQLNLVSKNIIKLTIKTRNSFFFSFFFTKIILLWINYTNNISLSIMMYRKWFVFVRVYL